MVKKPTTKTVHDGIIQPKSIILTILSVIGIGAVFYRYVEGMSWLDSFYFCVITLTTVGYGDITPQTSAGKIFTIFYILIGVGIIAGSLSYLLRSTVVKRMGSYQLPEVKVPGLIGQSDHDPHEQTPQRKQN